MKLSILIVEDEAPVRAALTRDLAQFASTVRIEVAEDVDDAKEVVDEIVVDGDIVALILCDHRLPGMSGVDYLIETAHDPRLKRSKKVLVTGQAGHEDTIRAINLAHINHYVAKPWHIEKLTRTVRDQLTDFVIENAINPLPHLKVLDSTRAMDSLRQSTDAWGRHT
ncbi:MAG TPA: response regulator [Actinomycetaceae bacterium]|nr:response regulator [Actinomycetaceae bacterium]